MATKIQIRRDTASNWASNNPTLSAGEFGFETNTGKFKIGTGSAAWTSLSYSSVLPSDLAELSQDAINDAIVAGTGLDKTYDDSSNTITIDIDSTVATKTYVDTALSNIVDGAPDLLNTLNELAAAINDDASYTTTITNALAAKAPLESPTFSGTVTLPDNTISNGMMKDDSVDTAEIKDSAVTSAKIANGTIVNDDISSSAAISLSKLATDPRDRSTHTGTQLASTISDFNESAQDAIVSALNAGTHTGITVTYSDNTNAISLAAGAAIVPSGSSETAEPQTGQLFFDTDVNSLKIFYGGIWLVLATVQPIDGGSPATSYFDYSYDAGDPSTESEEVIDGGTP